MSASDFPSPPVLSVVVPVYNERESLPILHEKLSAVLERLGQPWEVIYVDDGSTDGSTAWLRDLAGRDPRVILAEQRRNFGKSLALDTGFALVRGERVITLDADLQDEPEEIPRLLAALEAGYDVVSGWKQHRQDPPSKTIPSRIANGVTRRLTGVKVRDMNSGFKAYRVEVVRTLRLYGDLHRYVPVLAHYNGFRVGEIPVAHHRRQYGRSKYGPGRLLRGGFDLLTVLFLNNFRYRPLHLFGLSGGLMALLGLVINLYLTIEWLGPHSKPLSQRPLLTLGVLLMMMGVQLLTIGLLAELFVSHIQRQEDPLRITARVVCAGGAAAAPRASSIGDEARVEATQRGDLDQELEPRGA